MVKSPFQIIFELLVAIIQSIISTLKLVFEKLVELFFSLTFIANTGIAGLISALIIGGIVTFLITKFIFKNTKSLFQILLIYAIFVGILLLAIYLTTPISETPAP